MKKNLVSSDQEIMKYPSSGPFTTEQRDFEEYF